MMGFGSSNPHYWWRIAAFVLLLVRSFGLNTDGVLLLSFKYSVISDPLLVLESWNYEDETPCSWNGVLCSGIWNPSTGYTSRVISLVLPNSQLLGLVPTDLGMIEHLQHLDLCNNFLNGTLPFSLFNASELQVLALSNNVISGGLPKFIGGMRSLQFLNLSDNAFSGNLPENLTALQNLTVLSLSNNYFSGGVPSLLEAVEVLDLSSNLINGSLPPDFGGHGLRYMNLSYNRLSGEIPPEFAKLIPANATLDFSFNNLTGEIPESGTLFNQKTEAFAGNPDLCGKPLKNPCSIPSTISTQPNISATTSPPAIAAIPKTIDSTPVTGSPGTANGTQQEGQTGLRPGAIAGIVVGDLAGIGILAILFLYVYQVKKKKKKVSNSGNAEKKEEKGAKDDWSSSSDSRGLAAWSCLRNKGGNEGETSETTGSESEGVDEERVGYEQQQKGGSLVTVDGETELELETLLKASAYILGATGSSILYKAVLEDGTTLAVRRMGESGVERLRDFENQVRVIAKLRHPNLVRTRGFYWGDDEKLIIYEFVPNGSLANASYSKFSLSLSLSLSRFISFFIMCILAKVHVVYYNTRYLVILTVNVVLTEVNCMWFVWYSVLWFRMGHVNSFLITYFRFKNSEKMGSSPCHLPWDVRLKIARGVARGLTYIHEKKHVHGNLKPSNILLGSDMEPKIADLGLERLVWGENSYKAGGSARHFGSKRSTASRDSIQDLPTGASPSPSTIGCASSYHAPESLKNLKPNPKWDVYSFGLVLLELLTGKILTEKELGQWSTGFAVEEKKRVLRMADVAIRADVEGREDALLACFKLGFSCASMVPQKRPSMKEAVQALEKIPSSSYYHYM
ncbi:hypothetical protein HHK36_008352 [Tetracentron sinense]|uniref:Protein kinase domain-containing protein n=1 Tax=Tetracentron sinense TaxID=13715 RepID=A0A834ZQ06_TETSI|nr:hypothetical protein HHK36_008352 [Tetracentron sinense]